MNLRIQTFYSDRESESTGKKKKKKKKNNKKLVDQYSSVLGEIGFSQEE